MGQKAGVYHGFIAGQSGSGKTTLLNNIIASIAKQYSPDEIRLYLLDYKQGIEFQIFEKHPNVELLLLDNTNFDVGIKSLEKFNDEINKRAKLFLEYKARSIDEYNKKVLDKEKMPRMLMIIDEVQQLFMSDYKIKRAVNDLFKEIVKQGGAFGIHLFFSSQTYTECDIAPDALSNMKLRISYRLANGNDCRAIMGRDNEEPLNLPRFHLVYNTEYGRKDGNITVKEDDFEKENIKKKKKKSAEKHKGYKPLEKKIYDGMEETIEIEQNDNKNNKYDKEYFGF
jgi:DNA segregation ATPase FtsK/SpoIIIE-like protein